MSIDKCCIYCSTSCNQPRNIKERLITFKSFHSRNQSSSHENTSPNSPRKSEKRIGMLRTHDNWEKLVTATLRKEQLRQLIYAPSISSIASSQNSSCCPSPDFSFRFSPTSSCYREQIFIYSTAEQVYVNNKILDSKELSVLKGCSNPPRKLKQGTYYWYDKRAGFWGKIGRKPSQVISANLDIGGRLDRCASNGNTLVYINGREITKVELGLLKFSGVRCYRNSNIWMYEDGSYSVQGLACIRASIWSKTGMKLLCSVLSLSFPYTTPDASEDLPEPNVADVRKLLLIGRSGSGKSTIFKQAKFLYKDIPFMEEELNSIKCLIRNNIYRYIRLLLEAHQDFEEAQFNEMEMMMYQFYDEPGLTGCTDPDNEKEIYSISPKLKAFSLWLLNVLASGSLDLSSTSIIQHYALLLEELWKDTAILKTLERAVESRVLPSVAGYFLTRAVDMFRPNYVPSRMDILHAEDCHSVQYLDFAFSTPEDSCSYICTETDTHNLMPRYRLIRSPASGFEDDIDGLEMFEDVGIVIFCVPLSEYDQFVANENGSGYINMMTSHKMFFESVVTHTTFEHACTLLLLTKYDLFEEKLKQSPLNQCDFLSDFSPVRPAYEEEGKLAEMAFHYISVQFKRLYSAATGRKLYVSKVNSLDEKSVDGVMNYAQEILKWNDDTADYRSTEENNHCLDETTPEGDSSRRKFLICI